MFRRLVSLAVVPVGLACVLGCQPRNDIYLLPDDGGVPGDVVDLADGDHLLLVTATVEPIDDRCDVGPVELGWVGDDEVEAAFRVPTEEGMEIFDVVMEDSLPVGIPRLDMDYVMVDGRCEGEAWVEVRAERGEGWFRIRFEGGTNPLDHHVEGELLD